MKSKRVIVWGTGHFGSQAVQAVIEHSDLELVGVHAWSPEKLGSDAGDLGGVPSTGITATGDVKQLLALEADCVAYFSSSALRDADATHDIVPFLENGTNVVSISHFDLQYPNHGNSAYVQPVVDACTRGRSSVLLTGTEPGFAFGQHLFSLLSVAGRVDRIDLIEASNVQEYNSIDSLRMYGFNEDLEHRPQMFTSSVGAAWHISTLRGIADFMDVGIDDVQQSWDTAAVNFDYETAAFGTASAGKTAGVRWTVQAMVEGSPFIVYQKILRLHDQAGPDWPLAGIGRKGGVQKILVSGDPNYEDELHRSGGRSFTPLAAINAIPYICDAPPGVVLQQDLPPLPPRNVPLARTTRGAAL